MTAWRSGMIIGVGCAIAAGVLGDRAATAAGSAPPAVSIVRNTSLNGRVWPGDFNGDGKTDLVASDAATAGNPGVLLIALGNGAGSFGAPIKSSFAGQVLGVGDFNHDGNLDVVAVDDASRVFVIAGNGDGTLGSAHLVADLSATGDVTFAVSADFDGDGHRDLVVGIDGQTTVEVFPGNGDLTFGTPVSLTTNPLPSDAIVADFNGDGRKDLAVTNRYFPHSVAVFLNQGGFTFTAADIPLDQSATDVAAGDVNGDGKVDLVISTAAPEDAGFFTEGYVNVLLGRGNGTFASPTVYTVPPGPWQIVVGDFTRDGILDIATANRSPIYVDDCGLPFKTWDSVTILPGNGDGTFAAPSSFSLGDQGDPANDRFKESVVSLNTSDLNGDRQTDLIASQGAILMNVGATTNHAPTVNAGTGATLNGGATDIVLQATAADADNDMLTYTWTASDGRSLPHVPSTCVSLDGPGTYTFTVTVADGHGHTASSSVTYAVKARVSPTVTVTAPTAGAVLELGQPYTITFSASSDTPITRIDVAASINNGNIGKVQAICSGLAGTATSCVWNNPSPVLENNVYIDVNVVDADGDEGFAVSGPISIQDSSGGTQPLPSGWLTGDVGSVGAPGIVTYDNGVFTVKGDGADIWGTADAFQYASQFVDGAATGDFDLTAYVTSVQDVDPWTKAGVMVRKTLSASAAHAAVFVTPGKGIAFQRRTADGGTSVNTSVASVTAPVWLRLRVQRNNFVVAMYKKHPTDAWTLIGTEQFPSTPSGYMFDWAGLAVTSHHDGTLATATFSNVDIAPEGPGWQTSVIGTTVPATVTATTTGSMTLTARGADIWGTADQFTYAYKPMVGDTSVSANVRSVTDTNVWTKAGVMYRATVDPASAHVSLFVTPGKGIAMQYRVAATSVSQQFAQVSGVDPVYLRLRRTGNLFIGEWTTDLQAWHEVGEVVIDAIPPVALAGLALTSHDVSATATATFDDPIVR